SLCAGGREESKAAESHQGRWQGSRWITRASGRDARTDRFHATSIQMCSMNPYLVFTRDGREQKQALFSLELTIGRGKECDLLVEDGRISTQHCRLFFNNGEWSVADLRSVNRTFVNDQLVLDRPCKLSDGDILRFGSKETPLFEAR